MKITDVPDGIFDENGRAPVREVNAIFPEPLSKEQRAKLREIATALGLELPDDPAEA